MTDAFERMTEVVAYLQKIDFALTDVGELMASGREEAAMFLLGRTTFTAHELYLKAHRSLMELAAEMDEERARKREAGE